MTRSLLSISLLSLAPAVALGAPPEQNLAAAIRLETISYDSAAEFRPEPFLALHRLLETTYPQAHAALRREVVGGYSLLYTWRGSDPQLAPMLLTAHLDVVPVTAEALPDWDHPPFAGEIADGFVWGRGAIDDKGSLIAIFEAIEQLAAAGFTTRRSVASTAPARSPSCYGSAACGCGRASTKASRSSAECRASPAPPR
jgi:carboxypeptidase PM20D1